MNKPKHTPGPWSVESKLALLEALIAAKRGALAQGKGESKGRDKIELMRLYQAKAWLERKVA